MNVYCRKNLKIINADCMDIMKTYKNNYFDLAIVDPPYMNNIKEYMGMQKRMKGETIKKTYSNINNFGKPNSEYFKELFRISKNQIIFGINHFENFGPGRIIWNKDNTGQFNDCELAYQSKSKAVRIFKWRWNGMLQQDMKNKETRIHPTQKPVKLYDWVLINYSDKGHKIIDTHLGSGSSAIAAYYYGCQEFVGVEIDKIYYDSSIKRIKEQTNQLKLL
jgi:site-specific DNA-methyltransferase (adenine-specific)